MILAEKIMSLRKQNGWSQEELAEQLDVSRQSVSKWESATSIPDIEKILKMSQLFGVSTDYLLKDDEEMDETPQIDTSTEEEGRPITLEFATEFMDVSKEVSKKIALGVSLCVFSPVVLMLLAGLSDAGSKCISENLASGVGACVLLALVASAVAIFVMQGMRLKKYEFLEKEPIVLKYGVEAAVNRRKESFEPTFKMSITIGVVLCIVSVIPLFAIGAMNESDLAGVIGVCVLLTLVSVAVFLFVSRGIVMGSYQKLLQEGDYTVEKKQESKKVAPLSGVYWCIVTGGYLAWSFITNAWESTWIVWPVAGVLFPVYLAIANLIIKNKEK